MKTSTLVLLALSIVPAAAHADYNLSAKEGPIHCSDSDGGTVTINAARTLITVKQSGSEGRPDVYKVTRTDTDGDTAFEYIAGGKKNGVTLDLDDQGDKLIGNDDSSDVTPLQCE